MSVWWNVERRDRIAVCTFTRPPRNFMSFAAMTELEKTLDELAADESVSIVVLTGGVDGYFVAHADLDDLTKIGRGEPVEGDPLSWFRSLALLESMPQPAVAAINGQAHGGGSEISWACTLRLLAKSGHMGQPEVVVGIIPGAGGTQRLPRLIGTGRAADLILSGRIVGADEALRMGLANAVLPDEGFVDHVIEWLQPMARNPRPALAAAKKAMVEGVRSSFDDGLRLEGQLFVQLQTGPEAIELEERALRAYREGRESGL
ncbi:MAG: enoyl-CoA hydratase/isomerase family protein [Actinomycetota bacterium]